MKLSHDETASRGRSELVIPGGMQDKAYLQLQVGIRILINAPGKPMIIQGHAFQEVIIQVVPKAQVI